MNACTANPECFHCYHRHYHHAAAATAAAAAVEMRLAALVQLEYAVDQKW